MDAPYQARDEDAVVATLDMCAAKYGRPYSESEASADTVLRRAGWRVVRIWEHELKKCGVRNTMGERRKVVRRIQRALAQR